MKMMLNTDAHRVTHTTLIVFLGVDGFGFLRPNLTDSFSVAWLGGTETAKPFNGRVFAIEAGGRILDVLRARGHVLVVKSCD